MIIAALSPALFFLLAPCTLAQAKSLHPDYLLLRGEVQQYGDWLVACDNGGDCTMLGFPRPAQAEECDYAVVDMAIRISLTGPPGSDPVVELEPFGRQAAPAEPGRSSRPFVLNVDYDRAETAQPHGFSRHALSAPEAAGAIEHLAQGKALLGRSASDGKVRVRFPGNDFARAYQALQRRRQDLLAQSRQETLLRRIPAKPLIVSGYAPILSSNRCGKVPGRNFERFQFADGAELWVYECADGQTTRSAHLAMAGRGGTQAVPLRLPDQREGPVDATGKGLFVGDFAFDFDFGILRLYQLDQARSDCGTFRAWGYTAQGWVLLERREMPLCRGLDPDRWIRTYHRSTLGAGPDD